MPLSEYNVILAMASRLNIHTFGDLAKIKKQNNLKSNEELYNFLFMQVVKG